MITGECAISCVRVENRCVHCFGPASQGQWPVGGKQEGLPICLSLAANLLAVARPTVKAQVSPETRQLVLNAAQVALVEYVTRMLNLQAIREGETKKDAETREKLLGAVTIAQSQLREAAESLEALWASTTIPAPATAEKPKVKDMRATYGDHGPSFGHPGNKNNQRNLPDFINSLIGMFNHHKAVQPEPAQCVRVASGYVADAHLYKHLDACPTYKDYHEVCQYVAQGCQSEGSNVHTQTLSNYVAKSHYYEATIGQFYASNRESLCRISVVKRYEHSDVPELKYNVLAGLNFARQLEVITNIKHSELTSMIHDDTKSMYDAKLEKVHLHIPELKRPPQSGSNPPGFRRQRSWHWQAQDSGRCDEDSVVTISDGLTAQAAQRSLASDHDLLMLPSSFGTCT